MRLVPLLALIFAAVLCVAGCASVPAADLSAAKAAVSKVVDDVKATGLVADGEAIAADIALQDYGGAAMKIALDSKKLGAAYKTLRPDIDAALAACEVLVKDIEGKNKVAAAKSLAAATASAPPAPAAVVPVPVPNPPPVK